MKVNLSEKFSFDVIILLLILLAGSAGGTLLLIRKMCADFYILLAYE